MWLEADCNLASGEALVRQILFGKTFFKKEFGIDNRILWLPDVFGYSATLPQILKKSGIDYFMTSKISWSEFNRIPYDVFMWRGIDGSEVLTYFLTTADYNASDNNFSTYNGKLNPSQVMGAWKRYQQKYLTDTVLISYGFGDGGGPTREMLECGSRMKRGIPGCPKVKLSNSLDFFKKLEHQVTNNQRLPKWVGELYLEYHRGTYTSMGRNKRCNRKSEFLYKDAELLSVMTNAVLNKKYPQDRINDNWRRILLNQFHDILPGSSIKEVYDDSKTDYQQIFENGYDIVNTSLKSIAENIATEYDSIIVFNQLGYNRNDVVEFELPEGMNSVRVCDNDGNDLKTQITNGHVAMFVENIPAKGYKTFRLINDEKEAVSDITVTTSLMSNKFFDIEFDKNGHIISIHDKVKNRQVLKIGEKANVIQAFEDRPLNFDAWDINIYYQEKMWTLDTVENMEIIKPGPVKGGIRIERKFINSTIVQEILIYSEIPKIDFRTWIDWHEELILLKAAFPVEINSNVATYDIQFGNIQRPTHWNTSWDYARFEVCAHKWADLSEGGYGISLLNDCKYGHDIKDSVIRLTLLKSALYPNKEADKEIHEFTYSIYPHSGDWKYAETEKMAQNLNSPMYVKVEPDHIGCLPTNFSLISIDKSNVIVDTIKKAEDSDDIIIRIFEHHNKRTVVNATLFKKISCIAECDLMENDIIKCNFSNSVFSFDINPYEIKTFKIKF